MYSTVYTVYLSFVYISHVFCNFSKILQPELINFLMYYEFAICTLCCTCNRGRSLNCSQLQKPLISWNEGNSTIVEHWMAGQET